MKQRKLNYRFHDPNPAGMAANYILKILIEANASKVEQAVRRAACAPSDAKVPEDTSA